MRMLALFMLAACDQASSVGGFLKDGAEEVGAAHGEVLCALHPDVCGDVYMCEAEADNQTLGGVLCYADWHQQSRPDLRVHERVHVVQGMCGSVLYSLAYGLTFLWFWMASGFGPWKAAYYKIPFERQAYRIGDKAKGWGS